MSYRKTITLTGDEIDTLSVLIQNAIENIGHPLLAETETEKEEKKYLNNLKEKVERI